MSQIYTVTGRCLSEYEIKRSRFIAVIAPAPDPALLDTFLQELASTYPQASHITYAFRIQTPQGLRERAFDAGEPSGTAGRPILTHLQGRNLINVCLAVVRYFGGIKLGAGGLARAYSQAARQALEKAVIIPHIRYRTLTLEVDYARFQTLDRKLAPLDTRVVDAEYGAKVRVTLQVPESSYESVQKLFPS